MPNRRGWRFGRKLKRDGYDPLKLWNNIWWKNENANHRLRTDTQTDAPASPSCYSHIQAHKTRLLFLLHFKTKILRYIYTINIVFIFIVAVAYFCCEIYLLSLAEYELGVCAQLGLALLNTLSRLFFLGSHASFSKFIVIAKLVGLGLGVMQT